MRLQSIWTIGHSNRQIGEFLAMLQAHAIERIADVRRFPGSRRQPQFGRETLQTSLFDAGCDYRHFADLGGRRSKQRKDSPNGGWRVESFNAYADYMLTEPFQKALENLMEAATEKRTAIMCSEAVPWRCHRRLISDALVIRGWTVWDILSEKRRCEHVLTDFARVENNQLTYPAPAGQDDA